LVRTDFFGGQDFATGVVIQADGKIVVGGYANVGGSDEFALVRYNADGTLDSNFGTGGLGHAAPAGSIVSDANGIVLMANGQVVLGGVSNFGGNDEFSAARFNPNGSLDLGFGVNGWAHAAFSATSSDSANAVAVQSDGSVVLAGVTFANFRRHFGIMRFTPGGVLDNNFDVDGKVTIGLTANSVDVAQAVALQGNGQIVVGGFSTGPGACDCSLV